MGEVRIIGGQWKRSKLPVPDAPGLRPTSDRIRETLFNWLGQTLTGWRVLDAFAGSGALGLRPPRATLPRWCWWSAMPSWPPACAPACSA